MALIVQEKVVQFQISGSRKKVDDYIIRIAGLTVNVLLYIVTDT